MPRNPGKGYIRYIPQPQKGEEVARAVANVKLGVKRGRGTLGTFPGVFTPSILTILGIILFLRLGYVVGNAGLGRALIIIGLANVISILTSISLSAIATNLNVKRGGDYYLISRTLGVEFGGAIGIVLFLAQSVSVAFYCIGFGEAIAGMMPRAMEISAQLIAAAAIGFLFLFAWLGADWATRLQYAVMGVMAAALISFFAGGLTKFDPGLLARNWTAPSSEIPFWMLFAIFFPAVTGFTQGVSMSGDLKEPSRSLPLGTLTAVGLSILIYFGVAVVFAGVLPVEELGRDFASMKRVAAFAWLINLGVIAATLSSGMASFLGAPRILQAMAQDRIFRFLFPFARGAGPALNPRRGVLLSLGIALATVSLGQLNVIAPLVTMFFLVSYGLLNYATFFEARAASPAFRPTFRWFHSRLSLLGAVGCLAIMAAIDVVSSAAAIAVLFGIHQYLKRTGGPARWADGKRSYHLQIVREHLFAIPSDPEHPRDWRPQLLAFSDHAHRRRWLIRFASWIEGGSGFTSVVRILGGEEPETAQQRQEAETEIRKDIDDLGLKAFVRVIAVPSLRVGAQMLIQSYGIGPLRTNTLLLNGPEQILGTGNAQREQQYGRYLSEALELGQNVVILNAQDEKWKAVEKLPSQERRIDLYWWEDATGHLMLLFAYLMTRNEEWREARIRVLSSKERGGKSPEELQQILQEVRINAEPEVLDPFTLDAVVEKSAETSVVFFPLRVRRHRLVSPIGTSFEDLLQRLPLAAFVTAAEDIHLEAEPEEGEAARTAAARDAAEDAKRAAQEAEKDAAKAEKAAAEKMEELKVAEEKEANRRRLRDLQAAALKAEEAAEKAAWIASRARAEADRAADSAQEVEKEMQRGKKP